jgi:hypothetical protein
MLVFAVMARRLWNTSGCQNVSTGMTVPKGVELYLYPAPCGSELGTWTSRGTRKWNRRQARKGRFYLEVYRTWAVSGGLKQNIRNKIKSWVDNQHLVMWHGPCSTQRQARKLISGLSPATKARLLSCNRTQSRVVTGLLTEHNTLRSHLYVKGLSNNPTCRECGTEEETSVHILC